MLDTIIMNLDNIFAILGGAVTFATLIVGLTPSTKDDAILAKVVGVLNYFSVLNPKGKK
jgi:hypothetical protein